MNSHEVDAAVSNHTEERSMRVLEALETIWHSRWLLVRTGLIMLFLSVAIALLLPSSYRSTVTILPETDRSKLAALGGISDLAALAGVNVGGEPSLAKLYPTLLKSRTILERVILQRYRSSRFGREVDLIEYWEIDGESELDNMEEALKTLRAELTVTLDTKTNVLTATIGMREPQLAADVLNSAVATLDEYLRTKRTTSASQQRKWIEARTVEVKVELEQSEDRLKSFRERNRRVSDSPQLMLEHGRLMRDVEISSTVFVELKKQDEIARIEEVKNIPVINVLDPATPPARREWPRRTLLVLVSTVLGVVVTSAWLVFRKDFASELGNATRMLRRLKTGGHDQARR